MKRFIFNFICEKSERIKCKTPWDINDDGLSIIDVESKHKALKVSSRVPNCFIYLKAIFMKYWRNILNDIYIDYIYILQFSSVELERVPLFYKHVFVVLMNHCKEGWIRYTVKCWYDRQLRFKN